MPKMTKEQLEQLTDGELSMAILKIKTDNMGENYRIAKINTSARCVVGTGGFGSLSVSFDINSWDDMGVLIKSNGIIVDGNGSALVVIEGEYEHITNNDNCLRAAAIVYLLTQGNNHD